MNSCENSSTNVIRKEVSDNVICKIKELLEKELNLDPEFPLLPLAFDREGNIIVIKGERDFNNSLNDINRRLQESEKPEIRLFTPASIVTVRGSSGTSVCLGGDCYTHVTDFR